jgi:hypothetical protein
VTDIYGDPNANLPYDDPFFRKQLNDMQQNASRSYTPNHGTSTPPPQQSGVSGDGGDADNIQERFRDNLDHVRLIRKDGTTISVSVLVLNEIKAAYNAGFDAGLAAAVGALPRKKNTRDNFPAELNPDDFDSEAEMKQEEAAVLGIHSGAVSGWNEAVDAARQQIRALKRKELP